RGVRAQFRGSDMPLAPFTPLVPRSVDLSQGRGSGHLTVLAGEHVRVDVDAALDRVLVDDRRVAHVPLELSGRIEAALGTTTRDGAMHVALERARFRTGALTLEARGSVRYDRPSYWLPDRGDIELSMPRLACADALASLPEGLRDHLAGMDLDGGVQAAARLRFDREHIDDTSLELDVDVSGCTVEREPEAADPRRLLAPFEQYFGNGTRRHIGAGLPGYVPLQRLPRYLPLAFVAGEDARFFEHHGFDVYQIERSLAVDLRDRAFVRGGSTISQQTVKNLFLSHRRTLARKLQEAVLTWRLEAHLGKEQILERYLNVIELGPGVFGIDEAARYWFGKEPSAIAVHEAAFLAALTPAPQTLSRRILEAGGIDDDMRRRIDIILANMRRERIITEADQDRARRARLVLAPDATRG
ncbi:MAG TPA: biosynthetic peptidoglycan transglycosylase, partial [Haliangium sp.]|nr:biosynthetic peptidoglycan transglycosylase [Haliangium sp.]